MVLRIDADAEPTCNDGNALRVRMVCWTNTGQLPQLSAAECARAVRHHSLVGSFRLDLS